MEIKGLSARADLGFQLGSTGSDENWQLMGSGVAVDIDTTFDEAKLFWGKFRIFFNTGSGEVRNGERLASVDDLNFGIGLLAGVNLISDPDYRISIGAGYGMGFGVMSVAQTDIGEDRWTPDCPSFAEITQEPEGINCYLKSLDGSYSNQKLMAEVGVDLGAVTFTPFFEWSLNSRKEGQILPGQMFRFGLAAGLDF